VCGSGNGNGNTHTRFDKATHNQILLVPFSERMLESRRMKKVVASLPRSPSVDTTNGVKWCRCLRHGSRYLRFFSHSCRATVGPCLDPCGVEIWHRRSLHINTRGILNNTDELQRNKCKQPSSHMG
jgi:hypothetical protein